MKVYIENYGCSANLSNAEIIKALLKKENHLLTNNFKEADVIIINTCIVKSPTEAKMWNRLEFFSSLNKKVIVTGCMPMVYSRKILEKYPDFILLGTKSISKINDALKTKKGVFLEEESFEKVNINKIRTNKIINIVQISEGCFGNCSYCIVKLAKGSLKSFSQENILEDIKKSIKQGCKEIWITSQDNASYGLDFVDNTEKKSKLPKLLKEITKIKGDFFVRVGMMNPNNILPVLDELIDVFSSKKIFKFIHVPVQSGNDRILKLMNRNYRVRDFEFIIKSFRKEFPRISLSTDVICGFPTETREEFNDTIKLVKRIKPDVLNISKFGIRPYTEASKLKQLPTQEIKERSRMLTEVFNKISLERNKSWVGWKGNALIDEYSEKNKTFIARNYCYKPIVITKKLGKECLGKIINVKIKSFTNSYLIY
ncbi:MAG: tRNA (N(6)-L-threonylcarbamoyladenosine(37)-C(2))-methylthiotransferase [Candidatus Woesearchaeota archaeon]